MEGDEEGGVAGGGWGVFCAVTGWVDGGEGAGSAGGEAEPGVMFLGGGAAVEAVDMDDRELVRWCMGGRWWRWSFQWLAGGRTALVGIVVDAARKVNRMGSHRPSFAFVGVVSILGSTYLMTIHIVCIFDIPCLSSLQGSVSRGPWHSWHS